MKWTQSFALVLFSSSISEVVGNVFDDGSIDFSVLGTNDLSELEYEYEFELDEASCVYTLKTSFRHQSEFFVGTQDTCKPTNVDEYEGIPVLEGRWRWEELPLHIQKATGINHPSVDYNPCGHPGPGFLVPHYDIHFYTVTPEYRVEKMMCEVHYDNPTCVQAQTTPEGKGFYNLAKNVLNGELANMPPHFSVLEQDAVVHMGMHSIDMRSMPNVTGAWEFPVYLVCTHDSKVSAVEPMFPFHFVSGSSDAFYEHELEYVEQSIRTLPFYYSVEYKADTQRTTVTLKGDSDVCTQKELDQIMEQEELEAAGKSDDSGSSRLLMTTTQLFVVFLVGAICML